jgi:hypothetical protein
MKQLQIHIVKFIKVVLKQLKNIILYYLIFKKEKKVLLLQLKQLQVILLKILLKKIKLI